MFIVLNPDSYFTNFNYKIMTIGLIGAHHVWQMLQQFLD